MNTIQTMNGLPHERHIACISKEIDVSSSILKDSSAGKHTNNADDEKDPLNFTIPVYKKFKIRIYKPLIPLKLVLFLWYGAGSAVEVFITVFFKQKGVTLTELSTILAITPVMKFTGSAVSGIIADKTGSSKPVLVANLLLTVMTVIGMLVTPNMTVANCDPQPVSLTCHQQEFDRLISKTSCDINTDLIELASCNATCPENDTHYCIGQNFICGKLVDNKDFSNFSLSVHVSYAYKFKSNCYYNVTSLSHRNVTYSWCNIPHKIYCKISCIMNSDEGCYDGNNRRTVILILNAGLLNLFFSVHTNCFRFMDVTSMSLVKEHNSDYGQQRLFAITGILVFSPIAGYIVDVTTPNGERRNYDIVFYLFIAMVFILLPIIYKLDVQINPPGKYLWKKSLYLLKNPDIISFILVLICLGTAWGFMIIYLYLFLEGINSPTVLLGLVQSSSALYALPILVTSNWFVKKIGTNQIFILGLLGYVAKTIGYSLLYDPWLSLLIEVTGVFTYHLLWVTVVVHSHSLAPEGLTATVIALAGAIHYTLGKGVGGLIGGLIMDAFGERIAFRLMALICFVAAIFYAIFLCIRKTCYSVNFNINKGNGFENQEQNESNTMKEERYNLN